jgi:hypothetical protein
MKVHFFYDRIKTEVLVIIHLHSEYAVAQLVEALRYKPEGRGFDSRWCHWNFSMTSFRPHYGLGVDSASNRNEYHEYFLGGKGGRCVGLTTLPTSCGDCLEVWEPQPPGTLRASPGLYNRIALPLYLQSSRLIVRLSAFI